MNYSDEKHNKLIYISNVSAMTGKTMGTKTTGIRRGTQSLRQQVEKIKKQKIAQNSVVNLAEYRDLANTPKERKTILVVDDDEVMRNAIKRLLETEGFHVISAEDGLEFSKILELTPHVDLILLEINLPWVDGYELCQIIKANHDFCEVPLILISATDKEEDFERGFKAGCDEFLTKPFDAHHMIATVNKIMDQKKAGDDREVNK
jgi:two-component system aerobic respiration control protein ArcA